MVIICQPQFCDYGTNLRETIRFGAAGKKCRLHWYVHGAYHIRMNKWKYFISDELNANYIFTSRQPNGNLPHKTHE